MLRPTKRFGALLAGAVLLFVIGTNIQSGWLLVLSSLLLASLVAGSLLPLRTVRRVEVERNAPLQAHQGDRVRVELDVANRDRRPKLPLLVEDDHCSAIRVMTPSLRNGEGVRLSTTRVARRRGVVESSAVRLSSSAPFGVAVARRSIGVAGRTVVYPAVVPLGGFPAAWDAPSADRSTPGADRRGIGAEYLGIREYRMGDSMRHVHWPSDSWLGRLSHRYTIPTSSWTAGHASATAGSRAPRRSQIGVRRRERGEADERTARMTLADLRPLPQTVRPSPDTPSG